jgi:hypothetical protein
MKTETFINYWNGEEPIPPSPKLDAMPAYVDVTPLAFVNIKDNQLNFDYLCQVSKKNTIIDWTKTVRKNGTKVLFSIMFNPFREVSDVKSFVENVVSDTIEWGVDGVDIDYEPPDLKDMDKLLKVTENLRDALQKALKKNVLITAPIYSVWTGDEYSDFLTKFASKLDFVTTMDYTPYPGLDKTKQLFNYYARKVGTAEKVAIGVSCMSPDAENFTPLDDVKKICKWEPKKGMMLYNFSYDVKKRTHYPDGTFTKTINDCLT